MANSVRNTVTLINQALEGIFKGGKFYGLATLVEREGKGQPVVDEKPVSYDDSYAMQMYHRVQGATIVYSPGYGNTRNITDTFTVSAIVFNNEKITKLKTDELAMSLQSVLETINITSVRVLPTQIILNSQQIFATEYKGVPYALNEFQSLMQINYSVELSFRGTCFDLCPEDFQNCETN
jgi:hypothetical protein